MTGMKTPVSSGVSGYNSRVVTIQVAGVCRQDVMKTSNYEVRVPYSQMSQALQTINRQGGKVAAVQVGSSAPVVAVSSAPAEGAEPDAGGEEDAPPAKKSRRKRK